MMIYVEFLVGEKSFISLILGQSPIFIRVDWFYGCSKHFGDYLNWRFFGCFVFFFLSKITAHRYFYMAAEFLLAFKKASVWVVSCLFFFFFFSPWFGSWLALRDQFVLRILWVSCLYLIMFLLFNVFNELRALYLRTPVLLCQVHLYRHSPCTEGL